MRFSRYLAVLPQVTNRGKKVWLKIWVHLNLFRNYNMFPGKLMSISASFIQHLDQCLAWFCGKHSSRFQSPVMGAPVSYLPYSLKYGGAFSRLPQHSKHHKLWHSLLSSLLAFNSPLFKCIFFGVLFEALFLIFKFFLDDFFVCSCGFSHELIYHVSQINDSSLCLSSGLPTASNISTWISHRQVLSILIPLF